MSHILYALGAYSKDWPEVERYLRGLKQVKYCREVKFFDVVVDEKDLGLSHLFRPAQSFKMLMHFKEKLVLKPLIKILEFMGVTIPFYNYGWKQNPMKQIERSVCLMALEIRDNVGRESAKEEEVL